MGSVGLGEGQDRAGRHGSRGGLTAASGHGERPRGGETVAAPSSGSGWRMHLSERRGWDENKSQWQPSNLRIGCSGGHEMFTSLRPKETDNLTSETGWS